MNEVRGLLQKLLAKGAANTNTHNGFESIKSFYRSLLTRLRIRRAFNLPVACTCTWFGAVVAGPSRSPPQPEGSQESAAGHCSDPDESIPHRYT
jgi:hypothetical protein